MLSFLRSFTGHMELQQDIILEKIGSQLRKLREKKGWTLRQLSELSGIDNSRLSKIEQGKINVTLLTLIELCITLEVSPAHVLGKIR